MVSNQMISLWKGSRLVRPALFAFNQRGLGPLGSTISIFSTTCKKRVKRTSEDFNLLLADLFKQDNSDRVLFKNFDKKTIMTFNRPSMINKEIKNKPLIICLYVIGTFP